MVQRFFLFLMVLFSFQTVRSSEVVQGDIPALQNYLLKCGIEGDNQQGLIEHFMQAPDKPEWGRKLVQLLAPSKSVIVRKKRGFEVCKTCRKGFFSPQIAVAHQVENHSIGYHEDLKLDVCVCGDIIFFPDDSPLLLLHKDCKEGVPSAEVLSARCFAAALATDVAFGNVQAGQSFPFSVMEE